MVHGRVRAVDSVGARSEVERAHASGFMGWPPGTQRGRRGFSAIIVGVGVHDGFDALAGYRW